MARIDIQTDTFTPGWTLSSDSPAALAAIPDALMQVLDLRGDALAAWALHPDEQDLTAETAYREERGELGYGPVVEVRELPRPRRHNVVWIDRYHLLVASAPAGVASRLLGLYVGSRGRLVLALHHPSVSGMVRQLFDAMPDDNAAAWDDVQLVSQSRLVLRYDPATPDAVQLRAPQPMAMPVQQALSRIAQSAAGW